MNPLSQLHQLGQSVWLDYIDRELLVSGKLARLSDEDGVRGVTSNPTIFDKAISSSDTYDEEIRTIIRENNLPQLLNIMQTGKRHGMQTMDECLLKLYESAQITYETASAHARDLHAIDQKYKSAQRR